MAWSNFDFDKFSSAKVAKWVLGLILLHQVYSLLLAWGLAGIIPSLNLMLTIECGATELERTHFSRTSPFSLN